MIVGLVLLQRFRFQACNMDCRSFDCRNIDCICMKAGSMR